MHPYAALPEKALWKLAVAQRPGGNIQDIWTPKAPLGPAHRVVTFGSCFAQHIGRALKERGFAWHDAEPAPYGMSEVNRRRFNYGIFSCRTANIYTTSLAKQWVQWALRHREVPEECWTQGGRFYDPFRPRIEPDGFASEVEMVESRSYTLDCLARAIVEARYFVFTLGLTESWWHGDREYEYPLCPGTAAGRFDDKRHTFVNQSFSTVYENMASAMELMRQLNPKLRFILTVSPVPLVATNSGHHVLAATVRSKSVLRAVAGQLADELAFVDYFPSYELVTSGPQRAGFFEPNMRTVTPKAVRFVMDQFFRCSGHAPPSETDGHTDEGAGTLTQTESDFSEPGSDVVCEEELLAAFGNAE